jgi:hypothetical protein
MAWAFHLDAEMAICKHDKTGGSGRLVEYSPFSRSTGLSGLDNSRHKFCRVLCVMVGAATFIAAHLPVSGQELEKSLVVPNDLAVVAGYYPGDIGEKHATRQTIYAESQFIAAGPGPLKILGLAYRSASPSVQNVIVPQISITLSTTARGLINQGSLDKNRGLDAMLVYNHQKVELTARPAGALATPPFDIVFNFTRPFIYDPASGRQLVVDFYQTDASSDLRVDSILYPGGVGIPLRTFTDVGLFGIPPITTNGGLVTEFIYTTVPEPAAVTLFIAGIALLFLPFRRNKPGSRPGMIFHCSIRGL